MVAAATADRDDLVASSLEIDRGGSSYSIDTVEQLRSDHPEAAAPGEFHHLNHLGVETETADEVVAADARITDAGITTTGVEDAVCCFAEKTETWVQSPEGARWEWYVKSGDTDQMEHASVGTTGVCCG